jgi:uncharacterized membrane protein YesL
MNRWDQFKKEFYISSLLFSFLIIFGVIVVSIENGDLTILVSSQFWFNFLLNPFFYVGYLFCYGMVVFKRVSASKPK